jgi:hypothetical protein
MDGGGSHEAGTPSVMGKVTPSQDADKKGTDPVCGCCCLSRWDLPLPVFWTSTQVVSTGLSMKTLKENVGRFVLRPGLSIPWVTKRSGLPRVP